MSTAALNPGSRLLALVDALVEAGGSKAMLAAWTALLELKGREAGEHAVDAMQAALSEVRAWEERLDSIKVPSRLYAGTADELRNAFSPMHANASAKDLLAAPRQGASRKTLEWSAWVLRELDEQEIDSAEFDSLIAALAELEQELASPQLPLGMRRALQRQIASLRAAIRMYRIAGVEPLKEAVRNAVGELVTLHPDQRDTTTSKPAMQRALDVIYKAGEICEKAGAAMDVGEKLYAWSKIAAPLLGLPPPP